MSVESRAASAIIVGAILCVVAHTPGMAGQGAKLHVPGDFVVQKLDAVPAITIRTIAQTRDGYLWLGGYAGLYRFDGVRLVTFNVPNTPSLSSDSIRVLFEDRSTNLWLGTDDAGLMLYRHGKFRRVGAEQGFTETEVLAIGEDRDETLWVGTRRGLLFVKNESVGMLPATNVLATATARSLVADPDGGLWVGSSEGLVRLRRGTTDATIVLTNSDVRSVVMDADHVVWAAMDSGSYYRISSRASDIDVERRPMRYSWFRPGRDGRFWLASPVGTLFHSSGGDLSNATVVAQFERPDISSIFEDNDGNVWVGEEGHGLYRLRRKRVTTLASADGIPTENVTAVLEDASGRVWVGTFEYGLQVASGGLPFESRSIPKVINTTGMCETRDGTLWLGTYNGDRFRLDGSQFIPVPSGPPGCRVIYEDRDGAVWVGTLADGVERRQNEQVRLYDTRDGLSSGRVLSLAQDKSGDMWIGTQRGLNRISGGELSRFPGDEALRNGTIRGLYADRDGTLWIASWGSGLMRYHEQRLQTITSGNGLPSDSIDDVIEDNEGRMWLATAEGIACVKRDELVDCAEGRKSFVSCVTLGVEDGMLLARCGSGFKPSCMKSRSGLLWFCTAGGLVVVDPATIKPRTQPAPVYIEEVLSDDQPVLLQPSVKEPGTLRAVIRPGTSRVGFRYTALSLGAPKKVRFRYRLEVYDDDWVSARDAREAYYTRLPAGEYRFRVLAAAEGGAPNEGGATLAVVVVPSWWQTWWFRGLAIACLAGLVFGAYELRLYQHKKARTAQELFARQLIESQEQERKRVAGELHDSLGQNLLVIKNRTALALTHREQPEKMAEDVVEVSAMASAAIREVREIAQNLRPFQIDELGLTKSIASMARKVGDASGLECRADLDDIDRALPPEFEINFYRIVQECLNNVVKHSQAKTASIVLRREQRVLRLTVMDDGRGFHGERAAQLKERGFGLKNITERARTMGGEVRVQSSPGEGVRVEVTIPV